MRREVRSESWSLRMENFKHESKMFNEEIEAEDRSKEKGQSVSVHKSWFSGLLTGRKSETAGEYMYSSDK